MKTKFLWRITVSFGATGANTINKSDQKAINRYKKHKHRGATDRPNLHFILSLRIIVITINRTSLLSLLDSNYVNADRARIMAFNPNQNRTSISRNEKKNNLSS